MKEVFPTQIQRLYKTVEKDSFFHIMEIEHIFCETQHVSVGRTSEQVYVLNTDVKNVRFTNPKQFEANGLIITEGGELLCRAFPHILPISHKRAPALKWDVGPVYLEERVEGKLIMLFQHMGRIHIATPFSVNGMDVPLNRSTTYQEYVQAYLKRRFVDWEEPFRSFEQSNKYVWLFAYLPPSTERGLDDRLVFLSAIDKDLNTEVKREYSVRRAIECGFEIVGSKRVVSMEEANGFLKRLPLSHKGFVLRDSRNNRVYFRHEMPKPIEAALDLNRDVSTTLVAELILLRPAAYYKSILPDFEEVLLMAEDILNDTINQANSLWLVCQEYLKTGKRAFAQRVKELHTDLDFLLFMAAKGCFAERKDVVKRIKPRWLAKKIVEYGGDKFVKALNKLNKLKEEKANNDRKEKSSVVE